jgi:uncharacterized protein
LEPDQPSKDPSEPNLSHPPQFTGTNWLIGENGVRSGWRLLTYFVIVILLGTLFATAIGLMHKAVPGIPSVQSQLAQEILMFVVVFGAALIMSLIEGRSVSEYGLPVRELFGVKFWLGFVFGLVEIFLLIGMIRAFGGYSFGPLALQSGAIVRWGLFHLVFFVSVGFFEEFLFRGYTQYTLGEGIGFWPAAALLSIGFGVVHLMNPGEGIVGAASVVVVGFFFCFTLYRTGNLWYAVGLHASFDWGETFLFSVPNSGTVMQGHLLDSVLHGAKWLTGGSVGPEGSVFCFVTMGLQFLIVALLFPSKSRNHARAELVVGGEMNEG